MLRLSAAWQLVDDLHLGQVPWVWARDPETGELAAQVGVLADRRHGKSEGLLRYCFHVCETRWRAGYIPSALFVVHEAKAGVANVWPIVERLSNAYGWESAGWCKLDERNGRVTGYDGQRVVWRFRIVGADHPKLGRLLRGGEHDVVVIDEAQDFRYIDLKGFIDKVISSEVDDRGGRIFLAGTPGEEEAGYFWEVVVARQHPEWVVCHAEPFSNPFNAKKRRAKLERLKKANPKIEGEPWVRREYFGEWQPDNRLLIVEIRPELCLLREWKPLPGEEFVLGIDLGFDAPSAYVLGAWSPRAHGNLVYLDAWQQAEMLVGDHVAAIQRYQRAQGIYRVLAGHRLRLVGDPGAGGKFTLAELERSYGIIVESAKKEGKALTVSQLNTESSMGRIKFYHLADPAHPERHPMVAYWNKKAWRVDPITKVRSEPKDMHRHHAGLYVRRAARIETYREPRKDERSEGERIRARKAAAIERRRKLGVL